MSRTKKKSLKNKREYFAGSSNGGIKEINSN